jgi:hypothetical protein
MFIFFACPKKMNQQRSGERKDSRSLGPTKRDFPALLESAGSLKTRVVYAPLRGAQTVGVFAYLKLLFRQILCCSACVKWHKNKTILKFLGLILLCLALIPSIFLKFGKVMKG